jgi:hypothetical protein
MSELPTWRMSVELPVGFKDGGVIVRDAEVRAVTGADEFSIGMSPEYNKSPNDLVYKTLLLARCVVRLGTRTALSATDIQKLHARDVRALEYAVYTLTYGEDALPKEDPGVPGG